MMPNYNRQRIVGMCLLVGLFLALGPALGGSQETTRSQEDQAVQAPSTAQEPPAPPNPWDAYEVILKRNMFSRQRGDRLRQDRSQERREITVPNPESYFRLRGVAQEDDTFVAFLEDTRSGTVLELRQGDAVARGTIKSLTLDTIEYQRNDQVTTVRLGYDLEAGHGAVTMNELMQFSGTAVGVSTGASAEPAEAPTGEAADILKQLMERRKQELGQ